MKSILFLLKGGEMGAEKIDSKEVDFKGKIEEIRLSVENISNRYPASLGQRIELEEATNPDYLRGVLNEIEVREEEALEQAKKD